MFKKQLGFALPIAIFIVAVLIIVGGAGYYFYKTSQEQKEAEWVEPEQAIDETADWKIYRNEEYGFELKYPDRVYVVKFGPEYYAKADKEYWEKYQKKDWEKIGKLVEIKIPAFDGSANPLSAEIQIFKEAVFLGTPASLNDYSQLHGFIEKWYGVPLNEVETLRGAKEKERYIDNRAAIEIRYIEIGEDPRQQLPVVIIFTSNSELLYRIFCGSETGQYCDQILSTFKFIER